MFRRIKSDLKPVTKAYHFNYVRSNYYDFFTV